MKITDYSSIGFVFSVALLGALRMCRLCGRAARRSVRPGAIGVRGDGVAVQDDYVYYPAYQVYYSSSRHQYVYQDGRSWVSRPAPPHVAVNVLFASPSVNVGFHDSPANHHAEIARQYPKQWVAPRRKSRESRRSPEQ